MDDTTRPADRACLPSGRVVALDMLVRQRAERERIDSALTRFRTQCALSDATLSVIKRQFDDSLYLQGLTPDRWHAHALAILQPLLGVMSGAQETKINQILFFSSRFHFAEPAVPRHLQGYVTGEPIPSELFDAVPMPDDHTMHDITAYLANRMGRTVLEILRRQDCSIEVFLGPKSDMVEYYQAGGSSLVLRGELHSPTSTEFHLFSDAAGRSTVVLCGIANPSRFRHQLWQLKYAGIGLERVQVRGQLENAIEPQVAALRRELNQLPVKPRIVILGQRWWPMEMLGRLAGIIGAEGTAYRTLRPTTFQLGPFVFDYVIADIAGAPPWRSKVGLVAFRMPNGSLAGEAVRALGDAGMTHLLLAGAGGALDSSIALGTYCVFEHARYGEEAFQLPGSSLFIPDMPGGFRFTVRTSNLTVDSPLEETRPWLINAQERGCSVVDVESAHIFRALQAHPEAGRFQVTPGLFVSDIVGSGASLVEKIGTDDTYAQLQQLLTVWFSAIGIAGVHDADGTLWRFVEAPLPRNAALCQHTESVPDLTRSKLLNARLQTDDFHIVSRQRHRVGYPDLKAMMGHRPIVYLIPPAQSDMRGYQALLDAVDPESLFLCFPANVAQPVIDRARKAHVETIVIVEPEQVDLPLADFLVARDTGWGTYDTVVAGAVQGAMVFGDPSAYASLLIKIDNEDKPILVHHTWAQAAAIARLADPERFSTGDSATVLHTQLKLDRLGGWVARERPDIRVIKLSQLHDLAAGRLLIGISGSSKASQFDEPSTERVLCTLLRGLDPDRVLFVSGGTDYGVEKVLHRLIKRTFPSFTCVGLISHEGRGDDLGTPVVAIAGTDWFGRSVPFLNAIDLLLTVAGGSVVRQELLMAHEAGVPILPLAGSGMSTDDFLAEHPALPRYTSGTDLLHAIAQRWPLAVPGTVEHADDRRAAVCAQLTSV